MNTICGKNGYCVEETDGNISCICIPDYHFNPSGGIDCVGELFIHLVILVCVCVCAV